MSRRAADPAIQTSPAPAGGAAAVALDALFPVVYAELRRIAHRRLRSEAAGHTLSTTALVHETYLKLAEQRLEGFGNRAHFFALAARAMRRILVDYARRHGARKRPDPRQRLSLASLEDSGLQAVLYAAGQVATGAARLVIAGGSESMSNVEHYALGLRTGVRQGGIALMDRLERARETAVDELDV